ncbi:MAG: hypothetical protein IGS48_10955 [Oscillatoriales cyanobacterium C42_A2020_001]|nr:hypothetical protein [Leptolyngbyaceae cyanobacterium C42_A2020_001]
MRVWLTSFILLFGAVEIYQWASHLSLPMPIFVLGGAFLAIASNYDKLKNLPFHLDYEEPEKPQERVSANKTARVQVTVGAKASQPLSFEIRKPFKPGD